MTEKPESKLGTPAEFHSLPICVPAWGFGALFVASTLAAVFCFIVSIVLWNRGMSTDKSAAGALATIGGILLIAGVAACRQAIRQARLPEEWGSARSLKSSRLLRIAAFLIALLAFYGACFFLGSGIMLLNQEYLQWVDVNSKRSFGDTPASVVLWEDLIAEDLLTLIGVFLCWFAFFKGASRSSLLTRYHASRDNQQSQNSNE